MFWCIVIGYIMLNIGAVLGMIIGGIITTSVLTDAYNEGKEAFKKTIDDYNESVLDIFKVKIK